MKKYVLTIGDTDYSASVLNMNDNMAKISIDGKVYEVIIKEFGLNGKKPVIERKTTENRIESVAVEREGSTQINGRDGIKAPMPGVILGIKVKEGERIKAGMEVLIMEAMKMENEITAPYDGIVGKIHVNENDTVYEGELLVELKRPAMTTL